MSENPVSDPERSQRQEADLRCLSFTQISQDNTHWALRGRFVLDEPGCCQCLFLGSGWYEVYLDGNFLLEGPHRYDPTSPEWQSLSLKLERGNHLLAIHWLDTRVETRALSGDLSPYVSVQISHENRVLSTHWRQKHLTSYRKIGRRLGCVLGWAEWQDTRQEPGDWRAPHYQDASWEDSTAAPFPEGIGRPTVADLAPLSHVKQEVLPLAEGPLAAMSMADHDPPMSFVHRSLQRNGLPPNGQWWRFDLGRVKLGRPEFTLDCPPGALVQIAYSEHLNHERVWPYLSSGGGENSCLLDTWIARGGRQSFSPLQPKGARYLEVHVVAEDTNAQDIQWIRGHFTERCYYAEPPVGSFHCEDRLLNEIWQVGVDTLRSCAEDAITDNPTRERGQWLGDVIGPGMEILIATYSDDRPLKRGLLQAALCKRPDGLIPAIFPGTREFLPSFALQWVTSIPNYYRLTGNLDVYKKLHETAKGILNFFRGDRVSGGLRTNPNHWNFIDWGYAGAAENFQEHKSEAEREPALSLFYLQALQAYELWSRQLGVPAQLEDTAQELTKEIRSNWLEAETGNLGYHTAVLALQSNILNGSENQAAVKSILQHITTCFPLDPDAPRLESVHVESKQIITPFFLHFTLPVLIEHGEEKAAYDIMRRCWGWMLEQGATTWFEVFDPRWSHCHQWSGAPTWILSRYTLGLQARFDLAPRRFVFHPYAGDLSEAQGSLPVPGGGQVLVTWKRGSEGSFIAQITSDVDIEVHDICGTPLFLGRTWQGYLSSHGHYVQHT